MKIVLLGLEFSIGNKGCEALAYSFVNELKGVADELHIDLEITTVVFVDRVDSDEIHCVKIHYKDPKFWLRLRELFRNSDIVFDFTMGDSFSDIYGVKRFVNASLVKELAIRSKCKFVLGPQTYGPYNNRFIRTWATSIMKRSDCIYARDDVSWRFAKKLSMRDVFQTIDVAFSLPYEKRKKIKKTDQIYIGFNPSGLLWFGGYTSNNQFNLSVEYREYCYRLFEELSKDERYQLCLITHVGKKIAKGVSKCSCENDYTACLKIAEKFPQAIVIDPGVTPMDTKSDIAEMDIFIGARMHATIAAFSTGVATIPFSYSRKFEGLFNSMDYDYIIHATSDTTDTAVEQTLSYINEYQLLKDKGRESMEYVSRNQTLFHESIKGLINGAYKGDGYEEVIY